MEKRRTSAVKLSIVIPSLNDTELLNTIYSIRLTSPPEVEIIVVDDKSDQTVRIPDKMKVKVFRNPFRMGVAQSRQFGAEVASGDVILFLDAHMRCEPGWYENAIARLESNPKTIYNGSCLGLNEKTGMDLSKFQGVYSGATLRIFDPASKEILEGKWMCHKDDSEIPCLMGAIYFVPRDVFFAIGGLKALEQWGTDEPYLSLKAWLAGYQIKQLNTVRIGHKFRKTAPYATKSLWLPYNKIRAIMTIFDQPTSDFLLKQFPKRDSTTLALNKITERKKEVVAEMEFNHSIFKHDLEWFCQKFPSVVHPLIK